MARIQLRAPAVSEHDHDFITNQMQSGELFPGIKDSFKRATVMQRLLTIDYLIPSLFTLFRDIRYLEPAAELLKALIPPILNPTNTLRESLRSHFLCLESHSTLQVQQTENSFITITGNYQDLFELALRQLWLCSLRSISVTVCNAPKRDMDPVKRTANAPNYFLWYKLVGLAQRLGFSSSQITDALQSDPLEKMVKEMLSKLVTQQMGKLSGIQMERLTEIIKGYLSQSTGVIDEASTPCVTVPGLGEPLPQRCGIWPDVRSDSADRNHLFLSKVHAPVSEYQTGGGGISSFFVKRCRYLAFFGPISLSNIVAEVPLINRPHMVGC